MDMLKSKQVTWARIFGILMLACCVALGSACSDSGGDGDSNNQDATDAHESKDDAEAEASCDDGLKNGDETDVDCGGAVCAPCDLGQECAEPSDCESAVCEEGLCGVASCEDVGCPNADETCHQGECKRACLHPRDCGETAVFECTDGVCVDLCDAVSCGEEEFCYAGECVPNCESNNECLELKGYLSCDEGTCVAPCAGVVCDAGTQCYRGECYLKCDPNAWDEECESPTRCIDERVCVPTDCSLVNCGRNESCYDGRCIGG